MAELWKAIPNFPNYLVSNEGRVKSIARDYGYGSHGDMVLSQNDRRGYKGVTLFKDGYRYYLAVHRLVAEAFIPNPTNLPLVNHKDENRANNAASNLEWCDQVYNSNYGTCREKISRAVSRKVEQLTKSGEFIREWDSMTQAGKSLGIPISEISKCCSDFHYTAGGYKWRKVHNE